MVGPILSGIVRQARKYYRDARGKFISKAKYELNQRRGPSGKFVSKAAATRQRGVESYLRAQLGAPPAGKQWQVIAAKYPERFVDYLEGLNG